VNHLPEGLFNRYYRDIFSYLYSLTHDSTLAEDLTSEVFLEVVRSIGTFHGDSDIKTWLFSIARHRWYHYLRTKKKQPEQVLLSELIQAKDVSPEETTLYTALMDRIEHLLSQESERTQLVVRMRLSGYSFYEIGCQSGISESSARVIDFRAKAKIRSILEKEGFGRD